MPAGDELADGGSDRFIGSRQCNRQKCCQAAIPLGKTFQKFGSPYGTVGSQTGAVEGQGKPFADSVFRQTRHGVCMMVLYLAHGNTVRRCLLPAADA